MSDVTDALISTVRGCSSCNWGPCKFPGACVDGRGRTPEALAPTPVSGSITGSSGGVLPSEATAREGLKIAALVDLGNAAYKASSIAGPAEVQHAIEGVLGEGYFETLFEKRAEAAERELSTVSTLLIAVGRAYDHGNLGGLFDIEDAYVAVCDAAALAAVSSPVQATGSESRWSYLSRAELEEMLDLCAADTAAVELAQEVEFLKAEIESARAVQATDREEKLTQALVDVRAKAGQIISAVMYGRPHRFASTVAREIEEITNAALAAVSVPPEAAERCGDVAYIAPGAPMPGSFVCGLPAGHEGRHESTYGTGARWDDETVETGWAADAGGLVIESRVTPEAARRITHGRHCLCSACAREDWTSPKLAPCGMHGAGCPHSYQPLGRAGDLVTAAVPPEAAEDEAVFCPECGEPTTVEPRGAYDGECPEGSPCRRCYRAGDDNPHDEAFACTVCDRRVCGYCATVVEASEWFCPDCLIAAAEEKAESALAVPPEAPKGEQGDDRGDAGGVVAEDGPHAWRATIDFCFVADMADADEKFEFITRALDEGMGYFLQGGECGRMDDKDVVEGSPLDEDLTDARLGVPGEDGDHHG